MSSFYKRSLSVFICILIIMAVGGVRVLSIIKDEELSQVAVNQSTRRLNIAKVRGTIYDCNGIAITNKYNEQISVVFPTEQGIAAISEQLTGEELELAMEKFKQGTPIKCNYKFDAQNQSVLRLEVPIRYDGTIEHLIGYVDGSGHGVSGIEKHFDKLLYSQNEISVSYSIDSTGRMLKGAGWKLDYPVDLPSVTLTIDTRIQNICETAMLKVESGAAVVVDAKSGKIKAMVSQPGFDQADVAGFLDDDNSPLINRCLYSYNVGSVFKPCLAIAANENSKSDYKYNCTGSITMGDLTFKCNRISGHGNLGLKDALAYSCNTYFYTLGTRLGAESVYNTARLFKFGDNLNLGGGIVSSKGNLPSLQKLKTESAALVNLSIGQGDLLLSPVALSCMYSAIINGGEYYLPTVIEGVTENGVYKAQEKQSPIKAMNKSTAETIKVYLQNALQNGTGSVAFVEGIAAGGKTGTAQTGWKENGRSILNGWFCGYYEGSSGSYAIVILKEDVKSGSLDCAPIFKEVIEKLSQIGY